MNKELEKLYEKAKALLLKNESKGKSYIRGLLKVNSDDKFSDRLRALENDILKPEKEGLEKLMS